MLGAAAAAIAGCGSAAVTKAPPAPTPAPAPAPESPPEPAGPRWTPDARTIYLTVGHGEITSRDSVPPDLQARIRERGTKQLEERLRTLGYELADLDLPTLVRDVPDDAAIVFVLAPSVPLSPVEWNALGRYLDRGGRMVIALDPLGDPGLGSLEGKLGLRFNPAHLTDDKNFLPQRGTLADRRTIITDQFSAHPSTVALARTNKGMVLLDSGALEEVPFTAGGAAPTRTVTIRSMDESWLDLDDNFTFDDPPEQRRRWSIAAAVEGARRGAEAGFRALVLADVDLFADILVNPSGGGRAQRILLSGPLLEDAVRWVTAE